MKIRQIHHYQLWDALLSKLNRKGSSFATADEEFVYFSSFFFPSHREFHFFNCALPVVSLWLSCTCGFLGVFSFLNCVLTHVLTTRRSKICMPFFLLFRGFFLIQSQIPNPIHDHCSLFNQFNLGNWEIETGIK
jgi:hypothetical protein